eukprot:131525-Rhodomonas_salina.1
MALRQRRRDCPITYARLPDGYRTSEMEEMLSESSNRLCKRAARTFRADQRKREENKHSEQSPNRADKNPEQNIRVNSKDEKARRGIRPRVGDVGGRLG